MASTIPNKSQMIDEPFLKRYSPITQNTDVSLIFPFIEVFQKASIEPLIGSLLYEHLLDGIYNSGLTTTEEELLSILRQAVVWGTTNLAMPFIAVQIRNKGVMRQGGENTESADLDMLRYLRHEAANMEELYLKRANEWLCKNGHLLPDYKNPECPISPRPAKWDSDIFLSDELNGFNGNVYDEDALFRRFRSYFN